jgi:hypothetical protein
MAGIDDLVGALAQFHQGFALGVNGVGQVVVQIGQGDGVAAFP